jgi:hypothetical protein
MSFSLTFPIHSIPLWFLVLSLFLPRLCILVAWFQHSMPHYIPAAVGLIPIILWIIIPRLLILFWIYQDQGVTIWLLLHVIALLFAWGSGSTRIGRRRRVEVIN